MKLGWYQEGSGRVRRRENVTAVVIIIFGSSVGIVITAIAKWTKEARRTILNILMVMWMSTWTNPGDQFLERRFPESEKIFWWLLYNEVTEGNQESHDRKRVTLGQSVVVLNGHTVCTTQHEAWEPSQPHVVPWQGHFKKYHLYKLYNLILCRFLRWLFEL